MQQNKWGLASFGVYWHHIGALAGPEMLNQFAFILF
jgi:hypothetical protein